MSNQKKKFRVIIAGSREFNDYEFLKEKLNSLLVKKVGEYDIVIISGTANGADRLGEMYAEEYKYEIVRYPADWKRYGNSAGYVRNVQMADNADACVVFRINNSKGSTHMINIANEKNLLLRYYDI